MHFGDTPVLFAESLNLLLASAVRDVRQEDARVAVVVAVGLFVGRCLVGLRGDSVSR